MPVLREHARPSRAGTPHATSIDTVTAQASILLNSEGKIGAIKFVRQQKRLSLVQAKAYVEAIGTSTNPEDAARFARTVAPSVEQKRDA